MTPQPAKKGSEISEVSTVRSQDPDLVVDLRRRVAMLEADVAGLRAQVKRFDYDLQDAVDGFYRRRQSDRMREIREEESVKRPRRPTWTDIEKRVMQKLVDQPTEISEEPQSEEP